MEDLLGTLESSLNVTTDPCSTLRQHPRFSQFKQKSDKISQEERRRITLESQKQKRYDFQRHVRKLADSDFTLSDNDEIEKIEDDEMEWCPPKIKKPRAYKNQLMLSEWLVEVPDDFGENWLMVPSPVGKRCLVVASKGITKVYSKSGFKMVEFVSALPGGSRTRCEDCTILDCLWNEHKQTYFVLDVLCWGKLPMLGCEVQMRFYWLESKFNEEPELSRKCAKNRFPFHRVPFLSPKDIQAFFVEQAASESYPLDGLLFYHKLGLYTPGVSPLVGWLKPYMITEILDIEIPTIYLQKKPTGYLNIAQHLKDNKTVKKQKGVKMDIGQED